MLRVGLTGGIGSGKSTVVALLREKGLPVIEADDVAHEVIRKGEPAYKEIVSSFGNDVLQSNGEIDHARLASIVFSSRTKLDRLNQIVHPQVLKRTDRWMKEQEREGAAVAIVEAPLLVETGYHRKFDRLVVVTCRPEQQRERLVKRGMSAEEAERRMAAQVPVEVKQRVADDIIDNSGAPAKTKKQVAALAARLKSLAAQSPGAEKKERR
jgi:dephospho-CoA kinase